MLTPDTIQPLYIAEDSERFGRYCDYATMLEDLILKAEADGFLMTVERVSVPPLAMRNTRAVIHGWESHVKTLSRGSY